MFTGAERIVLCKNSSERDQAVSNSNSKAELKRAGGIRPMGLDFVSSCKCGNVDIFPTF